MGACQSAMRSATNECAYLHTYQAVVLLVALVLEEAVEEDQRRVRRHLAPVSRVIRGIVMNPPIHPSVYSKWIDSSLHKRHKSTPTPSHPLTHSQIQPVGHVEDERPPLDRVRQPLLLGQDSGVASPALPLPIAVPIPVTVPVHSHTARPHRRPPARAAPAAAAAAAGSGDGAADVNPAGGGGAAAAGGSGGGGAGSGGGQRGGPQRAKARPETALAAPAAGLDIRRRAVAPRGESAPISGEGILVDLWGGCRREKGVDAMQRNVCVWMECMA